MGELNGKEINVAGTKCLPFPVSKLTLPLLFCYQWALCPLSELPDGQVGPDDPTLRTSHIQGPSNSQMTATTTEESTKSFPVKRVHFFHNAYPKSQNNMIIKADQAILVCSFQFVLQCCMGEQHSLFCREPLLFPPFK